MERENKKIDHKKILFYFDLIVVLLGLLFLSIILIYNIAKAQVETTANIQKIEQTIKDINDIQTTNFLISNKFKYIAPEMNADDKTIFYTDEYVDGNGQAGYQIMFRDLNNNKKSVCVGSLAGTLNYDWQGGFINSTSTDEKI